MGEVIRFPDEAGYARGGRLVDATSEPATVIILPVIRRRATSPAGAVAAVWRAEASGRSR